MPQAASLHKNVGYRPTRQVLQMRCMTVFPVKHPAILILLGGESAPTMSELFFEDFSPGQIHKASQRRRVEKDEIIAFASKYDPQPFHLDEEAARKSIFGRLVASGWHTAAITMRLITESEYRAAAGTIGLGFDQLRWPMPVFPGDELRIESEVLEVRASNSRPDWGLLKMRTRTLNQNGEVVQELIANAMVPRRAASEGG